MSTATQDPIAALTERQQDLLDQWLPGAEVVAEHGWGLTQRTVLELVHRSQRLIVKAGGSADGHIARELTAHRLWLAPWTSIGRAPELVHGDEQAKLLVTKYLPGVLVLGHPSANDPDTYRQAGQLLAGFHAQQTSIDGDYERQQNERTLGWLDSPHRIPAHWVEEVRRRIELWPNTPAALVPTHGDWQPRNWLLDRGTVYVIDFGRAALRPAYTDMARLSYRDFARNPALERAFLNGYGSDPREPEVWERNQIREGVSTAAWAHQVGDRAFEHEGRNLLQDALWPAS